jgi:hypothetical protein
VYDALLTWVFALDGLIKSGQHTVTSLSYPASNTQSTSDAVFKALRSTRFAGASGPVSFDAATGDRSVNRVKVEQVAWGAHVGKQAEEHHEGRGTDCAWKEIAHFNVASKSFETGARWGDVVWPNGASRSASLYPTDMSSSGAGKNMKHWSPTQVCASTLV